VRAARASRSALAAALAAAALAGCGEIRGYRFLDGHYPDRELLVDLPQRLTTAGHPLDAFTDARHDSPHELELAAMLLEDLERGIGVAPPPAPGVDDSGAPRPPDDDAELPAPGAPSAPVRGTAGARP
jgi:hypothetical protein